LRNMILCQQHRGTRSAHGGRFDRLKRGAIKKEKEDAFDDYHKAVCHFGCPVERDAGICCTADRLMIWPRACS
jgi:hypothetical protein